MLFDWPEPQESEMWMKNTLVPLDMLFIEADGTIRHIAEDTVPHISRSSTATAGGGDAGVAGGHHGEARHRSGDKVLGQPFGHRSVERA